MPGCRLCLGDTNVEDAMCGLLNSMGQVTALHESLQTPHQWALLTSAASAWVRPSSPTTFKHTSFIH